MTFDTQSARISSQLSLRMRAQRVNSSWYCYLGYLELCTAACHWWEHAQRVTVQLTPQFDLIEMKCMSTATIRAMVAAPCNTSENCFVREARYVGHHLCSLLAPSFVCFFRMTVTLVCLVWYKDLKGPAVSWKDVCSGEQFHRSGRPPGDTLLSPFMVEGRKEILSFTSAETTKAYAGGSGIFISNTYSLRCHHQNGSALRWAAVWAILMFH